MKKNFHLVDLYSLSLTIYLGPRCDANIRPGAPRSLRTDIVVALRRQKDGEEKEDLFCFHFTSNITLYSECMHFGMNNIHTCIRIMGYFFRSLLIFA